MSYDAYPVNPPAPGPVNSGGADDLSRPLYGATFGQSIKRFFKKYAVFSGRASRAEYWWATLFLAAITFIPGILWTIGLGIGVTYIIASSQGMSPGTSSVMTQPSLFDAPGAAPLIIVGGILSLLIFLATIVPTMAMSWRRLHDANFAGPFWFLQLIPSIGTLIIIILMLLPPKPEGQRFDK